MALTGTKATAPVSIWQRYVSMVFARCIAALSRPSLKSVVRLTRRDGERVHSAVIGDWGEHLAARWLCKRGRKILYRNYRAPQGGEVDIVCREGRTLTFVEVKTRTSSERGRPGMAVDAAKEKLILRGARSWMRMLGEAAAAEIPTRCDIVEVILREGMKPEIAIIEGAFRIKD